MATSDTEAASASISVCPGQGWPAARKDSLWSGAVTTASTRPASASRAAARTAAAAARPPSADTCPSGNGPPPTSTTERPSSAIGFSANRAARSSRLARGP